MAISISVPELRLFSMRGEGRIRSRKAVADLIRK